jgi:hypothetical protein
MPPVLQLFGLGVYSLRCFDMMSYYDSDCDSGLDPLIDRNSVVGLERRSL